MVRYHAIGRCGDPDGGHQDLVVKHGLAPDAALGDVEHLVGVVFRKYPRGLGSRRRAPVARSTRVGTSRQRAGSPLEDPRHELLVVGGPGEPGRHRRHLQDHVGRDQGGDRRRVGAAGTRRRRRRRTGGSGRRRGAALAAAARPARPAASRARCRALLTAGVVVSSSSAISPAEQASASRRITGRSLAGGETVHRGDERQAQVGRGRAAVGGRVLLGDECVGEGLQPGDLVRHHR